MWLPYFLVAPQIIITFIFFLWPASQALYQSFLIEDAFGLSSEFVWFENFEELFSDPLYLDSFYTTVLFSVSTTFLSLSLSLLFAVMADRVIKGEMAYKSILLWPYAVAPAVAGVLWMFMFNTGNGILALTLQSLGYEWNHVLRGGQAMVLVIIAAAWKQISYNFIFFLAGLQSIPKSMLEASAIDGAGPVKRFWTIVFPLISPTTFFLIVVNVVYAFFDTFGIIHAVTQGGPYKSTEILVYKVYNDGFVGLDLGGSSAQSVILMIIVVSLTVFQFRYIERRVQY
jgi:sn-glycerol 3-phosphate transport system permease protein|tara:strand:- start:1410 stop:2264 length:855 start_codon:yes stop_codon:yes gene_type:complete